MPTEPGFIPADSPEGARLNSLHALVREIRGSSIDQTIWLDVVVTDIVSTFFCPDAERRGLFTTEILTGRDATFSGRIEVLEKLTRRWFPKYAAAHPTLFTQLAKIRRFRNRLAHSHLDTSDAFLAKGLADRIQLVFHENGQEKIQPITIQEHHERLKEGSQVMVALLELQRLVAPAT